jgi:alkanesulfonate monooxygenase SsuD/methylene tetrahydromethanopterin reductase-like flavin-dependent oxidoreductase (luciferase family)
MIQAMATATLNELSSGRTGFIGLGVGYKAGIEEYSGVKLEKPISKMKEYVKVLRGLLSNYARYDLADSGSNRSLSLAMGPRGVCLVRFLR